MTATIAVFGICQQQQSQKQQSQAPDKGLLIISFWFNRSTVVECLPKMVRRKLPNSNIWIKNVNISSIKHLYCLDPMLLLAISRIAYNRSYISVAIEMSISQHYHHVLTHCDLLPAADKNSVDDDDNNSNNWQLTIDNCNDDHPTLTPKLRVVWQGVSVREGGISEENQRQTGRQMRRVGFSKNKSQTNEPATCDATTATHVQQIAKIENQDKNSK